MVFVGSRHCVHCGARAREPKALDGTPWRCPRGHGELRGIALGGAEVGECLECGGLWVEETTFQTVVSDRTRASVVPQGGAAAARGSSVAADTVRYVPCPDCGKVMNRVNFAKTSGVILDACKGHGVWCDVDELRRVVEFVRAGGLDVSRRREAEQLVLERKRLEFVRAMDATTVAYHRPSHAPPPGELGGEGAGVGLTLLFSMLRE